MIKKLKRLLILTLLSVGQFSIAGFSFGATYFVFEFQDINDGLCEPLDIMNWCSLREALQKADQTPEDDALFIYSGADYVVNSALHVNSNVTIMGLSEPGQTRVTINSSVDDRIFKIAAGEANFHNFTITGANTNQAGAGVRVEKNADLILHNVHITHNSYSGPGVGGAGIYNIGYLEANDSLISDNEATTTNVLRTTRGGGILNEGIATLRNTFVTDNKAMIGGGIYNHYGDRWDDHAASLSLDDCTIVGNQALAAGGGIFSEGGYNYVVDTNIQNNFLSQNGFSVSVSNMKVQGGGGIYAGGGELSDLSAFVNAMDPSEAELPTNCTDSCHANGVDLQNVGDYTLEGLTHKIYYTMPPTFIRERCDDPQKYSCAAKAALALLPAGGGGWITPYRDFYVIRGDISGNINYNVGFPDPDNCFTVGRILWSSPDTVWSNFGNSNCEIVQD